MFVLFVLSLSSLPLDAWLWLWLSTEKTDLLKQAKAEADREVHQYCASFEQYQQMLTQGSTDTGVALQKLDAETKDAIHCFT